MRNFFALNPTTRALGLICASLSANALANTAEDVETITINATRAERDIQDIAANVTRIDAEQVDSIATQNIRDLFRYEPGIDVEGGGRYGLSSINIRGINGDRVLILLDGAPVADGFSFGPNLSSRRDFIDVDLIKSVEVIRGPASSLYGSDAIGGVAAFTSKDPRDIVQDGQSIGGRIKAGHSTQASQTSINGQLAGVSGDWQWLVNGGYRDGDAPQNYDDSANPQDNKTTNLLGKLLWTPDNSQRLVLTAETFNATSETDIQSAIGATVFGFMTTASRGDDERKRRRLSLHYQYQPANSWLHRLTVNAYDQSAETDQHSALKRVSLADKTQGFSRTRDSQFQQDDQGLLSQIDMQFGEHIKHYLIAGFEWQKTDSEALRAGSTIDAATGAPKQEFSVFPARDFPISTRTELSLYVQDEIRLLDGDLIVSPGVRYDSFELEAKPDAIFTTANPGVAVSDYDDSEITAKLGTVYKYHQDGSVWLQYAQGFRIPPMDDLNIGFTNFRGGYTSLANPDLKPERVNMLEVGLRHNLDNLAFSVSAYQNDYQDFIESLAVKGFNRDTNLLEFQARNIEDVEIKGIDLSLSYQFEAWQVNFATSVQDSKDSATGEEVASVLPSQTVFGVQYGDLADPWRVELVATYLAKANKFATPEGQKAPYFIAPSVTTFDVLAHYQITDDLRVNLGLFNLTDKKFWYASEVRGRTTKDNLDALTAPGRNLSANLVYNF